MEPIKIKKVFITRDNKVELLFPQPTFPVTHKRVGFPHYSDMIRKSGRIAAEKAILFDFFAGKFQATCECKFQQGVDYAILLEGYDRDRELDSCIADPGHKEGLLRKLHWHYMNHPPIRHCSIMYGPHFVRRITPRNIVPVPHEDRRVFDRMEDAILWLQRNEVALNEFTIVQEYPNGDKHFWLMGECLEYLRKINV